MSLYVGNKILAPGKGSQVSHLISQVAADALFPITCSLLVVHTGIKFEKGWS